MAERNSLIPQVRLSKEEMEAFICLPTPLEGLKYSLEDVRRALDQKGVVSGVDQKRLQEMIRMQIYDEDIQVAAGRAPVEGCDGFYEFHFEREPDKKPKLLPDGSVDYWSIKQIESVNEGQVIATYHPAVFGEDGVTVKGKPLLAKRVRELPPLKGKGFIRGDDNLTYTSAMDGKIEYQNDRIIIQQVYEIGGNVDVSIGHIDFRGDVVVHGSVQSGVTIKATGTITVDGVVEMAQLSAGKDITLRGGMMGGSKASVFTKGNISAKFFEYTQIEAHGDILADVFMNCDVICHQQIILSGKKGSIVGGKVSAVQGVAVSNLGSEFEVQTNIHAGIEQAIMQEIKSLQKRIEDTEGLLDKVEAGLRQLKRLEDAKAMSQEDPRKSQLLRIKIRDTASLSTDKNTLRRLEAQVQLAKGVKIIVNNHIYPGVQVRIDDLKVFIKERQHKVEFVKRADKIIMQEAEA